MPDPQEPVLTVDELLAALDAVTIEDVNGLAQELWRPERMSAAGVGGDELPEDREDLPLALVSELGVCRHRSAITCKIMRVIVTEGD